jgi:multiple sugar transport system ATP-binding protein
MDEPLSNLDAKLRVQMRAELSKLHNRLQTTIIYVTHDQTEAMTMGDRIVVQRDGFIQQVGAPLEIYNHPNNMFVAGFIGSPAMNFMDVILRKDGDNYIVDGGEFKLTIDPARVAQFKNIGKYVNKEVVLGVRPEDIEDAALATEVIETSSMTAMVDVTEPMGAEIYSYFSVGRHSFIARLDPTTKATDGEPLKVMLNMAKIHLFDKDTEVTIQ